MEAVIQNPGTSDATLKFESTIHGTYASNMLEVSDGNDEDILVEVINLQGEFLISIEEQVGEDEWNALSSVNVNSPQNYHLTFVGTGRPTRIRVVNITADEELGRLVVRNIRRWRLVYEPENVLVQVCNTAKDRYRFGFNGQEKTNELAGIGNHMTAKFWEYDTRLGRRWNLDPKPQISISDYAVLGNNPIWYNDVLGDIKNKNGKENSKQNPETLQEVVIKPQKQIPNSEVNATGGLFGGGGEMNLMQAAAKDVGRNDANREKADMAHQAVGLMMAMGAAPIAGVAAVEAGVGAWALNNLVLNGGKIAAWNIAGGAGDLTYQLATKDVKDVNFASVGSNALFGPLPSAFLGYTFNVSVNSLSGTKPTVVNPFNGAGLLNIGVGTMTNYGAGKLGEFLGIPTIRVGNVSAPNVLGPSLNMGANAAGNAAGTEIVNQVESK